MVYLGYVRQGRTACPPLHCLGVGFQGLRQRVCTYTAYQVQAKTLRYAPGSRTVTCQANNRFIAPTRYLHLLGSRLLQRPSHALHLPTITAQMLVGATKKGPRRFYSGAGCEQERVVSPCSPHSTDLQQPKTLVSSFCPRHRPRIPQHTSSALPLRRRTAPRLECAAARLGASFPSFTAVRSTFGVFRSTAGSVRRRGRRKRTFGSTAE